jgi:hypothetical protein
MQKNGVDDEKPESLGDPALSGDGILIIGGREIEALLAGRELEVADLVARAYIAHNPGSGSPPQWHWSAPA